MSDNTELSGEEQTGLCPQDLLYSLSQVPNPIRTKPKSQHFEGVTREQMEMAGNENLRHS